MSNFLDQFKPGVYDRNKIHIGTEKSEKKVIEMDDLETTSTYQDEERFYVREEETELDPSYKAKKQKKMVLIGVGVLLSLLLVGLIWNKQSHTFMPDFTDKQRQEVEIWAKKHKIEVDFKDEFSLVYDENVVISQEFEPKTKIRKGSMVSVVISKGPDLEEVIKLPDFEKLNGTEINAWIEEQKMRYIQVENVFSKDVAKGNFISFEIKDKNVTKDHFQRKNKALIKISNGPENYEKNIIVPDFKNRTKMDIELWAKEKEFVNTFTYEEEFDDKIEAGGVISQSVSAAEKVAKNDELTFVISKGKAVRVPDYSSSDLNTFDTINSMGAQVIQKQIYTMNYPYGAFVEQNTEPGTILNDDPDTIVIVYYSIGQPYIKGLVGLTEGDLPAYFYEFSGKGARITYDVTRVAECGEKGTVVRASKNNQFVSTTDHINIYISDGTKACTAPDA